MGKDNKRMHSFGVFVVGFLFILSWQAYAGSDGLYYQSQNWFPAYQDSTIRDGSFVFFAPMPQPQFSYAQPQTGPFIVQIPQPAARYIPPTRYALGASVIDWGWGPVAVDPAAAPAWIDYFHNRDYNRYYGKRQVTIAAPFAFAPTERVSSIVIMPRTRTTRVVYTSF